MKLHSQLYAILAIMYYTQERYEMLATISARVPVEVRNQVHKKLRNAGSSPSELINKVYKSYLNDELDFKKEPKRELEDSEKNEILNLIEVSTCNFKDPLPATFDLEAELEKGRAASYETLT